MGGVVRGVAAVVQGETARAFATMNIENDTPYKFILESNIGFYDKSFSYTINSRTNDYAKARGNIFGSSHQTVVSFKVMEGSRCRGRFTWYSDKSEPFNITERCDVLSFNRSDKNWPGYGSTWGSATIRFRQSDSERRRLEEKRREKEREEAEKARIALERQQEEDRKRREREKRIADEQKRAREAAEEARKLRQEMAKREKARKARIAAEAARREAERLKREADARAQVKKLERETRELSVESQAQINQIDASAREARRRADNSAAQDRREAENHRREMRRLEKELAKMEREEQNCAETIAKEKKKMKKESVQATITNITTEMETAKSFIHVTESAVEDRKAEVAQAKEILTNMSERLDEDEKDLSQRAVPDFEDKNDASLPVKYKVVLLGNSGDGKSTLANRLCGDESRMGTEGPFKTSDDFESETQDIRTAFVVHEAEKFCVVDTPGRGDSTGKDEVHANDLVATLEGIGHVDAFLWVRNVHNARVDEGDRRILEELGNIFSMDFWKNVVVVFTRVDSERDFKKNFVRRREEFPRILETDLGVGSDVVGQMELIGIGRRNYEQVKSHIFEAIKNCNGGEPFRCSHLQSPIQKRREDTDRERRHVEELTKKLESEQEKLEESQRQMSEKERYLQEMREMLGRT